MDIHEKHEQLEMQVLNAMRRIRLLDTLIFGGGTMLRLCFELPRYSVDLDFYLRPGIVSLKDWSEKIKAMFDGLQAEVTDAQEKHFTYLYEIRKAGFPRRLKLEIHKQAAQAAEVAEQIAFSAYTTLQVRVLAYTLKQMWKNKVGALLDRKVIRDAFDLEFLTRRKAGDFSTLEKSQRTSILAILDGFKEHDYRVVLGGVLPGEQRRLFEKYRFDYLKAQVQATL